MRVRVLIVAVAGLITYALPLNAPALASGGKTVISRTGIPAGFRSGSQQCNGVNAKNTARHVSGPGKPPLGTGSLQVSAAQDSLSAFTYALTQQQLHHLTTLKIATYATAAPDFVDEIEFASDNTDPQGDGGTDFLLTPASGTWGTINMLTATLTWQRTGVLDPIGTGTLAQYEAAHPTAQVDQWGVVSFGCDVNATSEFSVDDIRLGFSGKTTTYDFETPIHTAVVGALSTRSVISGRNVVPSATLRRAGKRAGGVKLTLWKQTKGAPSYSKVATAKTNAKGIATARVQHPTKTTSYQWRYAGDPTYAASTSANLKVNVAIGVTLALAKSSVAKGHPIKAVGSVSPNRVGATVSLWRKSGHRKISIGKAQANRHGSYAVTAHLAPGRYTVFATVAADATNTAGRSPNRTVTVG